MLNDPPLWCLEDGEVPLWGYGGRTVQLESLVLSIVLEFKL